MAKKAKFIVTLSFPVWLNLLYWLSYLICPKVASGSMYLRPLYSVPLSDVCLSFAFFLNPTRLWLTSTVLFPVPLKQLPLSGHPLRPVTYTPGLISVCSCCPDDHDRCLAAGIHVVYISVYDDLVHHPGMVRAGAVCVVKVLEVTCLDPVNDGVEGPDRVVFRNILVQTLRKKASFVWDCNFYNVSL